MAQTPDWLLPRQRILQRGGKRVSIRLEQEYWEQLEYCAKEEGYKLTDLVFRLFGESGADVNKSSLLRTFCARWMRKKALESQINAFTADIQGVLTSCPIPCVIVSREKKLLARNRAFSEKILGSLLTPDMWEEADTVVRFTLARPIEIIIRDVSRQSQPFVDTNVAFIRGSAMVQMVGRFCLLSPRNQETSPLLCFMDPK